MSKNVYLISSCDLYGDKIYKIGYTRRGVDKRIRELKTGSPSEFEVVKVFVADKYGATIESRLHRHFETKRIDREWFSLDDSDINQFEELCNKYYETYDMLQKNNSYLIERNHIFR